MRVFVVTMLGLAMLTPLAASAQGALREAISPGLSPEDASAAFSDAVMTGCVAAVAGGKRVEALGAGGKFIATRDAATRAEVGATPEETVWNVAAAKGVVTMHEKAGRCVASVYGPPAAMTVMKVGQTLAAAGFERMAVTQGPGISQSLYRIADGKRVQVTLSGSEPGMPGHKSRFSVVTATVFAMPAG
jgi:hypothetical protein